MLRPWRSNATYSDFEDTPDCRTAELIDGGLYLQPRSEVLHQTAASVLTMLLGAPPTSLDEVVPVAGGFYRRWNCISAVTSSFKISQVGTEKI